MPKVEKIQKNQAEFGQNLVRFPKPRKNDSEFPSQKKSSKLPKGIYQDSKGLYTAYAGKDPTTGKKIQRSGLPSAQHAQDWIDAQKQILKSKSGVVRVLAASDDAAAQAAIAALEAAGAYQPHILIQAVEDYLRRLPSGTPTAFGDLCDAYITHKTKINLKARSVGFIKDQLRPFRKAFKDRHIHTITPQEIAEIANEGGSTRTRTHRKITITALFKYAGKSKLMGGADLPIGLLEKEITTQGEDKETQPWTIAEMRNLLQVSLQQEDTYHCTAYILLGAYAGIRTSELAKLRFCEEQINIEAGIIHIPGNIAKNRKARDITMSPGLQRALQIIKERPRATKLKPGQRRTPRPTDEGSKVFYPKQLINFKQFLAKSKEYGGAGMPIQTEEVRLHKSKKGRVKPTRPSAWRANALRSSFASYYAEKTKNIAETAWILGHTQGIQVLEEHYRRFVKTDEGRQYFELLDEIFPENP